MHLNALLLALCSSLTHASEWHLEETQLRWRGGFVTVAEARWGDLPLDGPPVVRHPLSNGGPKANLPVLHPSARMTATLSMEEAADRVEEGWRSRPVHRGTRVLFPEDGVATLAWRFPLRAAGMTWTVWVDAHRGTLLDAQPETWSARTWVFDPNPVQSDLIPVDVPGVSDTSSFAGWYSEVVSCTAWDIDPRPFGERTCLEWAPQAKPGPGGDLFHYPDEGSTTDPFTEGQVYVHLHEFASWAHRRFGLYLGQPIQVFTNFPLTNAFFGDFDGDGQRDLSFGVSDDGYNFGHDVDVVVHEYGHALVRLMAGSMWMQSDELGLDWTPGALNEGVADTFAMIHNPDPILAEGLGRSERWERGIRDHSVPRACPGSLQSQVHRSGQVWGSTMWRLVDHPDVGPDLVADLLVGAVSSWSNSTDWPDAASSFLQAAEILEDKGLIDEITSSVIEQVIADSGMLDCERIVDLSSVPTMRQSLINYGLDGPYQRVPAGVQFKHPIGVGVDRIRLNVRDFTGAEAGTGLAIYLRMDEPIRHETSRVEGLGLRHATPVDFDAVVEVDESSGTILIDAETLPGFEPGGVVHGSLASINRSRGILDVAYSSVAIDAEALMVTGSVELESVTEGGCQVAPAPPRWLWVCLIPVIVRLRRSRS